MLVDPRTGQAHNGLDRPCVSPTESQNCNLNHLPNLPLEHTPASSFPHPRWQSYADSKLRLVYWARKFVATVDGRSRRPGQRAWPQPIQDLNDLIESTAELRMLASAMFDEIPNKEPYLSDPNGNRQIRDYKHMLDLFAYVMTEVAPKWSMTEYNSSMIGFPFNTVLDWPMATPSGYAFFLKTEVNAKIRVILDTWRDDILTTSKSQYVLTSGPGGWFSQEALTALEGDTNMVGQPLLRFDQLFECDTTREYWGFKSWDDFFVRKFRDMDKIRPVGFPDDPRWIANSCESSPYALQTNVKEYDTFWLKGQPYSVTEMLNHHPNARHFVGGTVYQAFLSATSYHRWHSPVAGKVVHAGVINGTFFSAPTITGFTSPDGPDPISACGAQGYITHVATRAVFFIQAEDPIGLVCVLFVGMADVSTCEISEKFLDSQGQEVAKGEELGMFHHGGSTHCVLFRKGLRLAWVTATSPGVSQRNIPVRSELAYAYE